VAKRTSLKDIARALGISEATVSLALNGRPVRAETRRRVLEYVDHVGYTPHPLARGLALQRSMMVGLVCPDTENPYFGSLVKHVSEHMSEHGYSLVLSLSQDNPQREADILKSFVDKSFDGAIVMPLDVRDNPAADFSQFDRFGIPVVFCTSYYASHKATCVRSDYYDGAYQLTRHLLETGHRELWYLVTADPDLPVASERLRGYAQAYRDLGVERSDDWVIPCDEVTSASGYEVVSELVASRPLPDGILALNDYMAFGVVRALHEKGVRVPDDVSVAGYDDVFYSRIAGTPLTTVRQDLDVLAQRCVELLVAQMRGEAPGTDEQVIIPSTLVVRQTTRDRRPG
jgi:LacI family transcriptional regulator